MGYRIKRRRLTGYDKEACYKFLIKNCPEKYKQIYGEKVKGIFNRVNCTIFLSTFMEFMQEMVSNLEENTKIVFEGLEMWKAAPAPRRFYNLRTGEYLRTFTKNNYKIKFCDSFWKPKDSWKQYIRGNDRLRNIICREKYEELEDKIAEETDDYTNMNL